MYKTKILFAGAFLVFAVVNTIIWQKETHISTSIEVKVKLQPVDPRSLMQGDYMRIRFSLNKLDLSKLPKKGFLKITLDDENFLKTNTLYKNEKLKILHFTYFSYRNSFIRSFSGICTGTG